MKVSTRTRQEHHKTGFTLIEFLVALLILGILSGLSIILFTRNVQDEKLKAAVLKTTAWLEDTRKLAIQNDISCLVTIDNSTETLAITKDTSADPNNIFDNCESIKTSNLRVKDDIEGASSIIQCSRTLTKAEEQGNPSNASVDCESDPDDVSIVFTPRGTATYFFTPSDADAQGSVLISFSTPAANIKRCLLILSPTGQIRPGKSTGGACDYTTAY